MNANKFWKLFAILMTICCIGAGLLACGQPTSPEPVPEEQDAAQEVPSSEEPAQEAVPEPEQEDSLDDAQNGSEEESQDGAQNGDEEGGEGIVEPAFGEDVLPCPPEGSNLILGFDHALTVNYAETSITHFLHQGWLLLEVTDGAGTIVSMASAPIPYTMEGVMSKECSLESTGTMTPSAHGSCEAGVVNLIIEESWSALEGQMTCIDTDGDVDILPFNAPPMGTQVHSGQSGSGEIFYLVEGAEGYSTMRPFLEGDGYHTWTLYTEEIPLVPLVPEE